jgi:hypothetical protein
MPGQNGTRLAQQRGARLRRSYAGAAALQQLDAELPLEGTDRLRQRGLADVEPTRRGRHSTFLGHGDEGG